MNKNIELVKKWLDDPDSVSLKELEDNRVSAFHAWAAAADAAKASSSGWSNIDWKQKAIDTVKKYEKLTK